MFSKIDKKGFTLVELLVVISIIALLASFSMVSLNQARVKARNANRLVELNNVRKSLQLYYDDNLEYPQEGCVFNDSQTNWNLGNYKGATNECYQDLTDNLGPYIDRLPTDPFGRGGFEYRYISNGNSFVLYFKLETTQGVGEVDYIEGR
ncbi:type II secretion system GspH family protein [bacterium]|nr:type II secretion system GspH family protein [bacterium]